MKQVKVFDEEHEDDLSDSINEFLQENEDIQVLDIKFSVAVCDCEDGQIYCFSALMLYEA
ncbi:sporulation protein Cse60 [[Eubacterium] hominis]|uniref:sporulation protein Cse60 n=1 Tax=[Eubacterium] hominis TaxID=2764325 RepID=UPI003A4DDA02